MPPMAAARIPHTEPWVRPQCAKRPTVPCKSMVQECPVTSTLEHDILRIGACVLLCNFWSCAVTSAAGWAAETEDRRSGWMAGRGTDCRRPAPRPGRDADRLDAGDRAVLADLGGGVRRRPAAAPRRARAADRGDRRIPAPGHRRPRST